jgi:uncharacterized protein (DUF302 family)
MPDPKDGLIHTASRFSVADTLQKLETLLQQKGMTIFATIDHSGEAAKIGMEMRPTKLLVFGNPRGGTPPMIASPTLAIDLPLKALVWEDAEGRVWVTQNSAEYLQRRHGFPRDFVQNFAGAATLIQKAVE